MENLVSLDEQEKKEVQVVFTPSGQRGVFSVGTSVLEAARKLGVDIDSVCGGRALCGRCQIEVSEGKFMKHKINSHPDQLSTAGKTEVSYAQKKSLLPQRRLSCMAKIRGDVVIDVPPESQVHNQVIRKRAEERDIVLNQPLRLYYVEVQEPSMHYPSGDLQRLKEALSREWRLNNLDCDIFVLRDIQETLRKGNWKVTVAIHDEKQIIALWSGYQDKIYGLAIDVGSTTIAAHLCDMTTGEVVISSGIMNPQIRFGEDLMSRVSYVMMNPGGEKELTKVVRESINHLIQEVSRNFGIQVSDIVGFTFVANPIMHHLLLGINPIELGGAPFALASNSAISLWAVEIDIIARRNARCYFLPCIAGHVGADTAGVILSESPHTSDRMTLIVDVGTNAEIVLGNRDRLLVCSSPTGPAFEGAQISCGQRAATGAIERVRIDPQTLEPKFKVIGSDLWSDETGFQESVRSFGVTGICGSGIIEVIAEMFLASILSHDGIIKGKLTEKTARVIPEGRTFSYVLAEGPQTITITQNDIRAIQLAKAALYAGINLLMDKLAIDHVDRIRFAGAFGSHIDVKYAMVLGLIPDCDLEHVSSAGNAAGTGARIALLDDQARVEIENLVTKIEKIETAVEDRFQEYFVNAMAFPHKTASFTNLAKIINLPKSELIDQEKISTGRKRSRRKRIRNTA